MTKLIFAVLAQLASQPAELFMWTYKNRLSVSLSVCDIKWCHKS